MKITCIIRDRGNHGYEQVMVYGVDVEDPHDHDAVLAAVVKAREADLGVMTDDEKQQIELLCCFAGDHSPLVDWKGVVRFAGLRFPRQGGSDVHEAQSRSDERRHGQAMGRCAQLITERNKLRDEVEEWKHEASERLSDLCGCLERETTLRAEVKRVQDDYVELLGWATTLELQNVDLTVKVEQLRATLWDIGEKTNEAWIARKIRVALEEKP